MKDYTSLVMLLIIPIIFMFGFLLTAAPVPAPDLRYIPVYGAYVADVKAHSPFLKPSVGVVTFNQHDRTSFTVTTEYPPDYFKQGRIYNFWFDTARGVAARFSEVK